MRKILALMRNEWSKNLHRVSVYVILGVAVGLTILASVGIFAVGSLVEDDVFYSPSDDYDYYESTIAFDQQQIEEQERKLAGASGEDKQAIEQSLAYYRAEMDAMQRYQEKKIAPFSAERDFLSDIISEIQRENANTEGKDIIYLQRLESIYESENYEDWIAFQKDNYQRYYSDPAEAAIRCEMLDMLYSAEPSGRKISEALNTAVNEICNDRLMLLKDYDLSSYRPLSEKRRCQLEDEIAVLTYRVEHDMLDTEGFAWIMLSTSTYIGQVMVLILIIILAGSAISSELATGSIKSLIIAPVRRWKIFTGKLLMLIEIGLAATLVIYLIPSLLQVLFYGPSSAYPYLYAVHGKVHSIPFFFYRILCALVAYIDVFILTLFAYCMSALTKHTAASVGVTMAVYFAGNAVNSVVMTLSALGTSGRWMKFLPSQNLSLTTRFFPYASGQDVLTALIGETNTKGSLTFCLIYLAVAAFCLVFTAYDAFTRRDI